MASDRPVILLIDDDSDFVEMNRHVLEGAGYRVMCCYEADHALRCMESEKINLVITDLIMKAMDSGFGLAKQIKTDPRWAAVPIILATSVTSATGFNFRPQNPQDLAAMHVDAYFDKPIPSQALLETVAKLLAGPR